jgi:hypothetical protein
MFDSNLFLGFTMSALVLFIYQCIHRLPMKKLFFITITFLPLQTIGFAFSNIQLTPVLLIVCFLLIYNVLEDTQQLSVHIMLPIIAFIILCMYAFSIHSFLLTLFTFFLFLGVSKLTREKYLGEGDLYFLLPLVYYLFVYFSYDRFVLFFFVAFFMASCSFLITQRKEFPFTPYFWASFLALYLPDIYFYTMIWMLLAGYIGVCCKFLFSKKRPR